jgi:signal transduction histidine kinase
MRGLKDRPIAPLHRLAAALLIGFSLAAACTWYAAVQPWLGLTLSYSAAAKGAVVRQARGPAAAVPVGTVLTRVSDGRDTVDFVADDFVTEPDGSLGTYRNHDVFLARQGRLAEIQAAPTVVFTDAKGVGWSINPRPHRPLVSLGTSYWVQLAVGVFAWLISSCIWAFRPGESSARYLLLSGFSTLMFAPFAGVYTTRELGLPSWPFRVLDDLNFLGGSLFAACLFSMLICYPRKIAPRWVGWSVVGLSLAWFVAQEAYVFESMTMARRLLVMIFVVGTFVLSAIQWRHTAKDPIARAALQWFLLSWVVGAGLFCSLILAPQMVGIDTSPLQGYAFLLFLLVYGGLAFGIMRFRLFDLGEWWMRTMLWTGSVVVLVLLDMLFLAGLQLSSGVSISLALLICGVLWLPLRAWVWGRFLMRSKEDDRALFERVVGVALAERGEAQAQRWLALFQATFDPLNVRVEPRVTAARIEDDGLGLLVPPVDELPGLRLEYANGGRRLFGRRDVALAGELGGMLRHVLNNRRSYEDGVTVERKRIARDMHDNIGAQLLRALHSDGEERKDRLIRETLTDLGGMINDAARLGSSLDEVLSDLRYETADRLQARGVVLDWALEEGQGIEATPAVAHTLRSVIREAVSNVVKHAHAGQLHVSARQDGDAVALVVEDDGIGFDSGKLSAGAGLGNMRSRVETLGGAIAWELGPEGHGTRLTARLPLRASTTRA